MSIRSRMWEKHEVNLSPVVRGVLSVALLLTASVAAVSQEQPAAQAAPAPAHATSRRLDVCGSGANGARAGTSSTTPPLAGDIGATKR